MNGRHGWLVLLLLASGGAAAESIEVPLTYRTVSETVREFVPRGYMSPDFTGDAPAGEWKWPEWKSKAPLFAMLKLGDRERVLVLDVSDAKSKMFDRLYFDANGNRDLSDDPVIAGKIQRNSGGSISVQFPPVDATVEVAGRTHPYRFQPSIYAYARESAKDSKAFPGLMIRFMLQIQCYYEGSFEAAGKKRAVILADANGNGAFDDALSMVTNNSGRYVPGDAVYLAEKKPGYYDGSSFGNHWHLDGQLYAAALDASREKLTLTPAEGPLYPVTLSGEAERLMLVDGQGGKSVTCFAPGREISLPGGVYQFVDYRLLRKETNGAVWQLQAASRTGSVPVEVGADRKAEIIFGEPFRPAVAIPEWSRAVRSGRHSVYMTFVIHGAGNEVVTDVSVLSGKSALALGRRGSRPKEATYTISTPDGELVQRGTFEYG